MKKTRGDMQWLSKFIEMLETIPIYRLVIQPETFFPEMNPDKNIIDLLDILPNAEQKENRRDVLSKKSNEEEKFYLAYLLVEARIFCRVMLAEIGEDLNSYQSILSNGDICALFNVIKKHEVNFLRNLLCYDFKRFPGLIKSPIKTAIDTFSSVKDLLAVLKKYEGTKYKLYRLLDAEMKRLNGDYIKYYGFNGNNF